MTAYDKKEGQRIIGRDGAHADGVISKTSPRQLPLLESWVRVVHPTLFPILLNKWQDSWIKHRLSPC